MVYGHVRRSRLNFYKTKNIILGRSEVLQHSNASVRINYPSKYIYYGYWRFFFFKKMFTWLCQFDFEILLLFEKKYWQSMFSQLIVVRFFVFRPSKTWAIIISLQFMFSKRSYYVYILYISYSFFFFFKYKRYSIQFI